MTTRGTHDLALDALFTDGSLPPHADAASITDALRDDADARRRFDTLALADRALHDAEVGEFERALGRASFLSNLDAMLDEEHNETNYLDSTNTDSDDAPHVAPVIPLFGPRARVVALAASALLVSALAYWASQDGATTRGGEDGFQARTAVTTSAKSLAGPPVEVFCVERDGSGEVEFRGRQDAPMGALSCPLNAELKLAHGDPGARRYVAMFGASRDGQLYWYGPSAAAPRAILAARSGRALSGFGESIRLGVNHAAGPVRVHALFSSAPLGHDEIKSLVERLPASTRFDEARLDVGDEVATSSVVFEVRDEEEAR